MNSDGEPNPPITSMNMKYVAKKLNKKAITSLYMNINNYLYSYSREKIKLSSNSKGNSLVEDIEKKGNPILFLIFFTKRCSFLTKGLFHYYECNYLAFFM